MDQASMNTDQPIRQNPARNLQINTGFAQRFKFNLIQSDSNPLVEDQKNEQIYQSNPTVPHKIQQSHTSIITEKLFGLRNHKKHLSFWMKCQSNIFGVCMKKHKKQRENQKILLDALRKMNDNYKKKQQRTEQLWRKVRALVNSGMFIAKIKHSSNSRLKKSQTGISDRKQTIIERRMTLLKMENNRYMCLIKNNSMFKIVWEFIIALVFIITFWIIPLNIAALFKPYQELRVLEVLIDFVIIIDIIINFISEAETGDGDTIIYLSDSSKHYLKTYFIIDVLAVMPLILFWESVNNYYYFKIIRFARIKRFFMFFKQLENLFTSFCQRSLSRPKAKRIIEIFKIIVVYYFIFHLHSCFWHYIGLTNHNTNYIYDKHQSQNYRDPNSNSTKGWISLVFNDTTNYANEDYLQIYLRSQYLIISSFATVGYGDIHATDQNEYIFILYLIMIGQLLFSFFTGKLKSALLKVDNLEFSFIRNELIETVELFMMKFSSIKGARKFKSSEIKSILQFVEASFQYNFKSIQKDEFYQLMSPNLRRKLIFHLFGSYQNKFLYFFDDFDSKYKASDQFTYMVLQSLQCIIITPGQVIARYGDLFTNLFFVLNGSITVKNKYKDFMVSYLKGSNIGDFQLILGIKTQFIYSGTTEKTSFLMSLERDIFLTALSQDFDAFSYLTKIALRRRKDLKRLNQELIKKTQERNRIEQLQKNKIMTQSFDSPTLKKHSIALSNRSFEIIEHHSRQDKVSVSDLSQRSFDMVSQIRQIQHQRKLRVLQLLQIRCYMQSNNYIGYFLEDLATAKQKKDEEEKEQLINQNKDSINIIKEEKHESSVQSQNCSDSDSSFVQSDESPLNSQDEISFDEEDEYSLPESYRFYSERIGETEHVLKKFKKMMNNCQEKFQHLNRLLKQSDVSSLRHVRETLSLKILLFDNIDQFVEDEGAKKILKKLTVYTFGGLASQISQDQIHPLPSSIRSNSLFLEDSSNRSPYLRVLHRRNILDRDSPQGTIERFTSNQIGQDYKQFQQLNTLQFESNIRLEDPKIKISNVETIEKEENLKDEQKLLLTLEQLQKQGEKRRKSSRYIKPLINFDESVANLKHMNKEISNQRIPTDSVYQTLEKEENDAYQYSSKNTTQNVDFLAGQEQSLTQQLEMQQNLTQDMRQKINTPALSIPPQTVVSSSKLSVRSRRISRISSQINRRKSRVSRGIANGSRESTQPLLTLNKLIEVCIYLI
ncbi:voltagegated ion channel superfamily [Stylonychia lemnae]|uniref:Voltagegated ion channel superfamily n=1 Tax=Stylonychia lemnae TaxID=5949 RepID=A0A078AQV1_STYLE|nr:voltagegated ion channel superfamily [Stylonychia lemnae]|eukprot:CDW83278.1 voltagegated ion channel superfamily [Stylonychia lemnae]